MLRALIYSGVNVAYLPCCNRNRCPRASSLYYHFQVRCTLLHGTRISYESPLTVCLFDIVNRMGLGTTVASTLGSISSHQALGSLSSQKALKLAHMYLEKAWDESDSDIALVLYRETELSLVQAKKAAKHENNQAIMNGIGDAFINLSRLLEVRNRGSEADVIRKKAEKLG